MLSEYTPVNWEDADSTATPLNAANLGNMDEQIKRATDAVRELERTGVSPEAIIAAVNAYLDEHRGMNAVYGIIDIVFSETDASVVPRLCVELYEGDYWLTYYDSEEKAAHRIFNFANLPAGAQVQSAVVNPNGTITFTLSDGSTVTTTGTHLVPAATVQPKNLLDLSAVSAGKLLNYTNGAITDNANRNTSDYFSVVPGKNLVASYIVRMVQKPYEMIAVCFYDAQKNYLSGAGYVSRVTVPSGAAYARVCGNTYFLDYNVQLELSDGIYPSFFEAYESPASGLSDSVIKANKILTRYSINDNFHCALPPRVYIKSGESLTIYHKNILSNPKYIISFYNADKISSSATVGMGVFNYDGCTKLTTTGSGGMYIPYSVHDDNFNLVSYGTLEAYVNAADAPTAKVLLIGDSTIAQSNAVSSYLLNEYSGTSSTLTLLGTRGSGNALHEGRSGWKAQEYVSIASRDGVTNAFWDGSAFNFSYYMTQQGYSAVDAVVIQLGINDIFNKTIENLKPSEVIGYIDTIVESIHDYSGSVKVIVNLLIPPNSDGTTFADTYGGTQAEWLYRYNTVKINRLLREHFRGSSNVIINGINLPLDTYTEISDGVHPKNSGYQKIAKTIYNCLAKEL